MYLRKTLKFKLKSTFAILFVVFLASKTPEVHEYYLDTIVGNKVAKIVKLGKGGGTGFHVQASSGNTYILTNNHVCEGVKEKDNTVTVIYEGVPYKKEIVDHYDHHDLCLVEPIEGVDGIKVASDIEVKDKTYLLGHPTLQPLTESKGNFIGYKTIKVGSIIEDASQCEEGEVRSALFFLVCLKDFFSMQITNYSRGGSSGSPLVNFWGNLVGVLFAGNGQDQFQSFAVPLPFIKDFLKDY